MTYSLCTNPINKLFYLWILLLMKSHRVERIEKSPLSLCCNWILSFWVLSTKEKRHGVKRLVRITGYQPFFEVKEDLSKAASSVNHVQIEGSQEGKMDSYYILRKQENKNWMGCHTCDESILSTSMLDINIWFKCCHICLTQRITRQVTIFY